MEYPADEFSNKKHHVFCYAKDLQRAANNLAGFLKCEMSYVFDGIDEEGKNATVAWIVGHGGSYTDKIGGAHEGDRSLPITEITSWLNDKGYTDMVDTCCEPDKRRKLHGFKGVYYCTSDGGTVADFQPNSGIETWWFGNNLHKP